MEMVPHTTKKTSDQLYAEFKIYHAANPRVYKLVKRFAAEALAAGYLRFGIAAIWERVRWEVAITNRSHIAGEDFKMPNNHRAYYARLWLDDHPEYNGKRPFFKTCELRSVWTAVDRYGRSQL
jgi:hypothetical protein